MRGKAECNFGMCDACIASSLASNPLPMGRREIARARRMHRCGRSLTHIGRVLGVPQPSVVAAVKAA
jgi:hypothetical protein